MGKHFVGWKIPQYLQIPNIYHEMSISRWFERAKEYLKMREKKEKSKAKQSKLKLGQNTGYKILRIRKSEREMINTCWDLSSFSLSAINMRMNITGIRSDS